MTAEKKKNLISELLLLITTVIWGSSFFILKNALDVLPTFFVLATRFSLGAGVVLIIYIRNIAKFKLKALLHGGLIGLCLAAAYALQTLGLKETTPGKNAFLTTAYVVITPFLGWIFLKTRPKWNSVLAAVLCIIGVGLISVNEAFHVERGDLITLSCGFFYALQMVCIKKFTADDDAGQLLFAELITAAIIFWIVTLSAEKAPGKISGGQIFPIIYLGIAATGLAQIMQLVGQKGASANNAALIMSLEAVFGTAFSMIFYHERLTLKLGLGFAVVFLAVLTSEINWQGIIIKIKEAKNGKARHMLQDEGGSGHSGGEEDTFEHGGEGPADKGDRS